MDQLQIFCNMVLISSLPINPITNEIAQLRNELQHLLRKNFYGAISRSSLLNRLCIHYLETQNVTTIFELIVIVTLMVMFIYISMNAF